MKPSIEIPLDKEGHGPSHACTVTGRLDPLPSEPIRRDEKGSEYPVSLTEDIKHATFTPKETSVTNFVAKTTVVFRIRLKRTKAKSSEECAFPDLRISGYPNFEHHRMHGDHPAKRT